jgi:hypothetical protein
LLEEAGGFEGGGDVEVDEGGRRCSDGWAMMRLFGKVSSPRRGQTRGGDAVQLVLLFIPSFPPSLRLFVLLLLHIHAFFSSFPSVQQEARRIRSDAKLPFFNCDGETERLDDNKEEAQ